ncbi:unnamed protein product, partial [Didymodactylos carnosus]
MLFGSQQPATSNTNSFLPSNNGAFVFGSSNQNTASVSTAGTPLNMFGTSTTANGSVHKFEPVMAIDKITKNNTQQQIRTKTINITAMTIYEKKSVEELRFEDYSDNRKVPSATVPFSTPQSLFPSL